MADFCQQCSIAMFGADMKDMAGLSTPEDTAKDMYCIALCEDCGPIQVDHLGKCVSPDCYHKHGAL